MSASQRRMIFLRFFIIAGIVLGSVAAGWVLFFQSKESPEDMKQQKIVYEESGKGMQMILVSIAQEGFSPSLVTIKRGEWVAWVNEDTQYRWPASNIHPTHEMYKEFDPREPIAPGERWGFRFDRVGTWHYHDHLFPGMRGVIKVEE